MKSLRIVLVLILLFSFGCDDSGRKTKEWTIIYYGAGDNDLQEALFNDVNEMETVNLGKQAYIVALLDQFDGLGESEDWIDDDWEERKKIKTRNETGSGWSGTRVFEIKFDNEKFNSRLGSNTKRLSVPELDLTKNSDSNLNTGDSKTLEKFIAFCKKEYPAKNYALIISNHGNGWYYQDENDLEEDIFYRKNLSDKRSKLKPLGKKKIPSYRKNSKSKNNSRAIAWDDTSWGDCLNLDEIREAIDKGLSGKKMDLLVFDACLMGTIEVAYELKDVAKYMVSSQEVAPWYGFPYHQIMKKFKESGAKTTADNYGKIFVEEFIQAYQKGTNVEGPDETDEMITMSLVDLSKIEDVVIEMNKWSENNSNYVFKYDDRCLVESFYDPNMKDLGDYFEKVNGGESVVKSLEAAVVLSKHGKWFERCSGLSVYSTSSGLIYSETNKLKFFNSADKWIGYCKNYNPEESIDMLELSKAYVSEIDMWFFGNDDYMAALVNAMPEFNSNTPTLIKKNTTINSFLISRTDIDVFYLDIKSGDGDIKLTLSSDEDLFAFFDYDIYGEWDYIETEGNSIELIIRDGEYGSDEDYSNVIFVMSGDGSFSQEKGYSIKVEML